ncbi:MAG: ABC transporter permease, partial [bacterium]|nr:ABC transporter permease [bacterium]
GLLLPSSWQETLLPYLPSNAGSSMIATHIAPHALSATSGLSVLVVWAGLALALAAILAKRRDA